MKTSEKFKNQLNQIAKDNYGNSASVVYSRTLSTFCNSLLIYIEELENILEYNQEEPK